MARILVVEDSVTEMFRFKELLGEQGYEVIEANNGADGVTLALIEQPDLIIMNVVMSGVNGFQATRHIAREQTTQHIPILIVSSKDQDSDRIWGMAQGASEYLTKPFNEAELLDIIHHYLHRSQHNNQPQLN